jgi:type VI secretion system secreted protein VgrG
MPEFLTIELFGIKTNPVEIGKSVVPVKTPEEESRLLTAGEIEMAKILFKDSIAYQRVRVHNGDFIPFGWQDKNTAVTPNGHIYFPKGRFKEDFSGLDDSLRHWLIHELVHVWQYQHGYPVLDRGLLHYGLDYKYVLDEKKHLGSYNMEAQGDLLADYWALLDAKRRNITVNYMMMEHYANDIEIYEKVLHRFLNNRHSWRNLPSFY